MSTKMSLVYLRRADRSTHHIYQEGNQVWVEDIRPLCTAAEWNATPKDPADEARS